MRILLIFFTCSVLGFTGFAQNNDIWRAGSAHTLNGTVYTLTCFISTPSNCWTPSEKKQAFFKIANAEDWIKSQARSYGIPLQFTGGVLGLQNDITFETIDDGNAGGENPNDWAKRVIEHAGSSTPLQVYDSIKKASGCANIHVVILAKTAGRGYSTAYRSDANKDKFFLEGTILYAEDNDCNELKTCSIAHEILHLYGAWDLYTTYAQTAEKETKAREIYPDDVMLRGASRIASLKVGELTAWLVGWKKETHPIYEFFRPSNRSGEGCCPHMKADN